MMGRQETPAQLFYEFDLEQHVPANHMLREIDCQSAGNLDPLSASKTPPPGGASP